jgi:hypothetical protein
MIKDGRSAVGTNHILRQAGYIVVPLKGMPPAPLVKLSQFLLHFPGALSMFDPCFAPRLCPSWANASRTPAKNPAEPPEMRQNPLTTERPRKRGCSAILQKNQMCERAYCFSSFTSLRWLPCSISAKYIPLL